MAKINIGEIQNQIKQIKNLVGLYNKALIAVSTETQKIVPLTKHSDKKNISVKKYMSIAYPALCKAAILYSNSTIEASINYLNEYLKICCDKYLSSLELKKRIIEAKNLIQEIEGTISNLHHLESSLSSGQQTKIEPIFQAMVEQLNNSLFRNKKKIDAVKKKSSDSLEFSNMYNKYYLDLKKHEKLVVEGLKALGIQTDGHIKSEGEFQLEDFSWINEVNQRWEVYVKEELYLRGNEFFKTFAKELEKRTYCEIQVTKDVYDYMWVIDANNITQKDLHFNRLYQDMLDSVIGIRNDRAKNTRIGDPLTNLENVRRLLTIVIGVKNEIVAKYFKRTEVMEQQTMMTDK